MGRWKAVEESYNFGLDLTPIGGRSQHLWVSKVSGVKPVTVSTPLYPSLVLEVGNGSQVPTFRNSTHLDPQVGPTRNLGVRQPAYSKFSIINYLRWVTIPIYFYFLVMHMYMYLYSLIICCLHYNCRCAHKGGGIALCLNWSLAPN